MLNVGKVNPLAILAQYAILAIYIVLARIIIFGFIRSSISQDKSEKGSFSSCASSKFKSEFLLDHETSEVVYTEESLSSAYTTTFILMWCVIALCCCASCCITPYFIMKKARAI